MRIRACPPRRSARAPASGRVRTAPCASRLALSRLRPLVVAPALPRRPSAVAAYLTIYMGRAAETGRKDRTRRHVQRQCPAWMYCCLLTLCPVGRSLNPQRSDARRAGELLLLSQSGGGRIRTSEGRAKAFTAPPL